MFANNKRERGGTLQLSRLPGETGEEKRGRNNEWLETRAG